MNSAASNPLWVMMLCTLILNGRCAAQEKAAFDPRSAQVAQAALPSPYDKFLGLDLLLNLTFDDWKGVYNELARSVDVSKFTDESDIALALGVRIADGVMAIKARDLESLNECAQEIEGLAQKLGVKEGEMSRAKTVRSQANQGEWLQVFLELGFLQTDILKSLRGPGEMQRRSLIITAGWMQGLHYSAHVVGIHYSGPASNCLREPLLVGALQHDLEQLPDQVRQSPSVAAVLSHLPALHAIVDIPMEGFITKDGVDRLKQTSGTLVEKMTSR